MNDSEMMAKGILMGMESLGVNIVKWDNNILYITVPAHSEQKSVYGVEMCGNHLAKRVQETLNGFTNGNSHIIVRYKIVDRT